MHYQKKVTILVGVEHSSSYSNTDISYISLEGMLHSHKTQLRQSKFGCSKTLTIWSSKFSLQRSQNENKAIFENAIYSTINEHCVQGLSRKTY